MGGQVCCCSNSKDAKFEADTKFAEATSGDGGFNGGSAAGPLVDETLLDSNGADDADDPGEEEKARLQNIVNAFTKQAARGRQCVLFETVAVRPVPREYRLNSKLEVLTFGPVPESDVTDGIGETVEVTVASIQHIHAYAHLAQGVEGAAAAPFPEAILKSLSPEERSLLVMLIADGPAGSEQKVAFLETSAEGVDMFLEGMRVLMVYAKRT